MADTERKCDIIFQTTGKWRDTQIEENALRWNPTQGLIERWNGSEWISILPTTLAKYGITDVFTKTEIAYSAASHCGSNLITNGECEWMSNYNFSQMAYDPTDNTNRYDGLVGRGCLKADAVGTIYSDEYIPINSGKAYTLEYDVKSVGGDATLSDALICYDRDGNLINCIHSGGYSGSLTTLSESLDPGDTRVFLNSTDGFNKKATSANGRGLVLWTYMDSVGNAYGGGTYSRIYYTDLWVGSSSFDGDTNPFITLKTPWEGETIPAGTQVSQARDTPWNTYGNTNYTLSADVWTHKIATFSTSSTVTEHLLFNATTYARFALFTNGASIKLANVALKEN